MLVIAFLVGHTIGATSNKTKRKPADEAPDIEQNDRKWEVNEERLNKLRDEITQALKEKGGTGLTAIRTRDMRGSISTMESSTSS